MGVNMALDAECALHVIPTLIVIDMQERLLNAFGDRAKPLIDSVRLAIEGAKLLEMPIIVTEQYPKGLGHTIPEILSILPSNVKIVAKTTFSCFGEMAFKSLFSDTDDNNEICLVGVETHVCVQQTAIDALNQDFNVHVLADATLSRKQHDMERSLSYMLADGACVTTVESFLFKMLGDANKPAFKAISKLVR